jgi:fructose-1,6-bisphosphatase/inositol monophosphatase family enzyme
MAVRVSAAWHRTARYVCRNLGSTAFEMGLIACGAMSGMLGRRVKIWDIAAGAILISEAGGIVSDPQGESLVPFRMDADPQQNIPILAATKRMHTPLLESIRKAMS